MNDIPQSQDTASESIWMRLLYMIVFGICAHIAFSLTLLLAFVQFMMIVFTRAKNEELRNFSTVLVRYIGECLSYVVFATEEKPFPLGGFPSTGS